MKQLTEQRKIIHFMQKVVEQERKKLKREASRADLKKQLEKGNNLLKEK